MARPSRDGCLERKGGKKREEEDEEGEEKKDCHTEIRQDTAHTVPMRGRGGVCVCVLMSGELDLCVYLSKQFTRSGVCYEAN